MLHAPWTTSESAAFRWIAHSEKETLVVGSNWGWPELKPVQAVLCNSACAAMLTWVGTEVSAGADVGERLTAWPASCRKIRITRRMLTSLAPAA